MTEHKMSRQDLEAKIIAKAWKDPDFKKKLTNNPRATLKELGLNLPENINVQVIEEKEHDWTLVIPKAPQSSKPLSEKELASLAGGRGLNFLE